ncbi:ribbon-helix-helix protein, CopG family [Nitrospira defluvii]|nr:ribbon-helix-helix protein, CopG family [Nitrospira defluvii]
MPTLTDYSPKSKITITLSPDLVRQLDTLLRTSGTGSRSQLVEEALRQWLRNQAQYELERQTEEYYRSLSKTEQKEDRNWTQIAAHSAERFWDK